MLWLASQMVPVMKRCDMIQIRITVVQGVHILSAVLIAVPRELLCITQPLPMTVVTATLMTVTRLIRLYSLTGMVD